MKIVHLFSFRTATKSDSDVVLYEIMSQMKEIEEGKREVIGLDLDPNAFLNFDPQSKRKNELSV